MTEPGGLRTKAQPDPATLAAPSSPPHIPQALRQRLPLKQRVFLLLIGFSRADALEARPPALP